MNKDDETQPIRAQCLNYIMVVLLRKYPNVDACLASTLIFFL